MKPKSCKVCKSEYVPKRMGQKVCSLRCAALLAFSYRAKADKVVKIKERREKKSKLEKLKTRSDWIKECQIVFNAFIRLRDSGKPCICCGRMSTGMVRGGDFDAGHYRSRGSAPHLRFDERNCHSQLKQCNRYDSGNIVGYRLGLINRIGLEAVESLESDQTPKNYSIEDLKAIKLEYMAKVKELRKKL